MIKHPHVWLSLTLLLLHGCATPQIAPQAPITPTRLPFPTYATQAAPQSLGGASWQGGQTEHVLESDGQWCGLSFAGRPRCWQARSTSPPPKRTR